jgi:hypothetical protein
MTIRFNGEIMPPDRDLLNQAAGVGIKFDPDSLAECRFLEFCYALWMHGSDSAIKRCREMNETKTDRNRLGNESL